MSTVDTNSAQDKRIRRRATWCHVAISPASVGQRPGPKQVAEYLQEAQNTSELNGISLFEDARLLQAQVEAEIAELERVLAHAVIVEPSRQTHRRQRGASVKRTVAVGTTVLLQTPRGRRTVLVVSSAEADAAQQKISDQSPVGSALLGHGEGEIMEVITPSDPQSYTIVSIS